MLEIGVWVVVLNLDQQCGNTSASVSKLLSDGMVLFATSNSSCRAMASHSAEKTLQKVLIRQNHQYGHTLAGRKYLILVRIRINSCNSTSLSGLVRWTKTQSLSIHLPYGIGESEKTRLTTEAQRKIIK